MTKDNQDQQNTGVVKTDERTTVFAASDNFADSLKQLTQYLKAKKATSALPAKDELMWDDKAVAVQSLNKAQKEATKEQSTDDIIETAKKMAAIDQLVKILSVDKETATQIYEENHKKQE